MRQIAYTEVRQNLKRIMDEITETKSPVIITRRDHAENAVLLCESEYNILLSKKIQTPEEDQDD